MHRLRSEIDNLKKQVGLTSKRSSYLSSCTWADLGLVLTQPMQNAVMTDERLPKNVVSCLSKGVITFFLNSVQHQFFQEGLCPLEASKAKL